MHLTPEHASTIAFVLRGAIRNVGVLTVTMKREADPEMFDRLLDSMPDEDVIGYVGGMRPIADAAAISPSPAPEPEPKPADPLIPKWTSEGAEAFRQCVPRDMAPTNRKNPHWLTGWDRAKAAHDADLAAAAPATLDGIEAGDILPPARTPETAIEMEAA